jgi:hypothetical protein
VSSSACIKTAARRCQYIGLAPCGASTSSRSQAGGVRWRRQSASPCAMASRSSCSSVSCIACARFRRGLLANAAMDEARIEDDRRAARRSSFGVLQACVRPRAADEHLPRRRRRPSPSWFTSGFRTRPTLAVRRAHERARAALRSPALDSI